MKQLPNTENPIVLRTDFFDQIRWEQICEAIRQPADVWPANVTFIDDQTFVNLTVEQIVEAVQVDYQHDFIFVVDRETILSPELAILVVDLWDEMGRNFRAAPKHIAAIETNLTLKNMDFYQFAENVDKQGIFLGF